MAKKEITRRKKNVRIVVNGNKDKYAQRVTALTIPIRFLLVTRERSKGRMNTGKNGSNHSNPLPENTCMDK